MRSAQRVALREINVDTLVSTLIRRGRHQRDRIVTLRREKKGISGVWTRDACMTGEAVRHSSHCATSPLHFVASELNDPICHSDEWQIGSFSSEATIWIISVRGLALHIRSWRIKTSASDVYEDGPRAVRGKIKTKIWINWYKSSPRS